MFMAAFDAPCPPNIHDVGATLEIIRRNEFGGIVEARNLERRHRLADQRRLENLRIVAAVYATQHPCERDEKHRKDQSRYDKANLHARSAPARSVAARASSRANAFR